MRIQVSGKHMDVGDALRQHVEDHIEPTLGKYSDHPLDATITFSHESHIFHCECSAHLHTGLFVRARASASDAYAAFEQARTRLEKQVRRYKRRLKDHHARRKEPMTYANVADYTVDAGTQEDDSTQVESELDSPLIIAESTAQIPRLSVGEAVMQMEMADVQFLLFCNDAHGDVNLVYRREDGNIGWVDTSNKQT